MFVRVAARRLGHTTIHRVTTAPSLSTVAARRLPPRVAPQPWAACLSTSPKDEDKAIVAVDAPAEGLSQSESIVVYALLGNLVIMGAKTVVAASSGSSAMSAEAVHSAVDAGNQALLLVGLRAAALKPSATHQYGYGKSVYLWSLVSALGTFWLGAGVALHGSVTELLAPEPSVDLDRLDAWDTWTVLGLSFVVDGAVLGKSLTHLMATKPRDKTLAEHVRAAKDPTLLAVLCEDAAACCGVVLVAVGMKASVYTGLHGLDTLSGVAVGVLLGAVGAVLAAVNGRYLIGSAVEPAVVDDIEALLRSRPAIDDVHSVQSQWVGPNAFAYKCEVDFDGTWVAAQLFDRYEPLFSDAARARALDDELPTLLSFYAEDVMRAVESEVRDVENAIRAKHPDALFIEIEPDARATARRWASDGLSDAEQRSVEQRLLDGYLLDTRKRTGRLQAAAARRRAEAEVTTFALENKRVTRAKLLTARRMRRDDDEPPGG